MNARALAVLALLAALAVGAVVVTRLPSQPANPQGATDTTNYFLPKLRDQINDVTAVQVRAGGGRLVARVERHGDRWVVANRYDYPADEANLRGALIALSDARRVAPKTRHADAWSRLAVSDVSKADAQGVELSLEGTRPPIRVIVGKPATGDVDGTYVRVAGDARPWLVSTDIDRQKRVGDWLDARLVDIPAKRVQQVRIQAADGQPVIVKHDPSNDIRFDIVNLPQGRRPLSKSIGRSLARVVADLTLDDVLPAERMPKLPRVAVARYRMFSGLVVEIQAFGSRKGDDGARWIRLEASASAQASDAVRKQARAFNARWKGWVYAVPHYKFVNMTQTLEGVLTPKQSS